MARRAWRTDLLIALAVALAAGALYFRTLAPGLLWGDSAEFQFAAWLGGFAHPTGYPLYLLMGWAWTHVLQWGDPAWRMNLLSAVWGAFAAGLTYVLATRVVLEARGGANGDGRTHRGPAPATGRHWPPLGAPTLNGNAWAARATGAVAALTFAATPTLWSQAVIAEVYTLHAAFVAAVLLAAVTARATRALVLTAALWGLGLAHHRSLLLLAPAVAVFLWWETRRGARAPLRAARLALLLLAFVLPLLLYLYVPLRAPLAPYASLSLGPSFDLALYPGGWLGFLQHVSGSVFAPSLAGGPGVWAGLAGVPGRLAGEVTWPGVALGVLGAGWLWTRRRSLLALTGLSFLAIVAFNAVYAIGDIHVFYIPAYLIWCLWIGAGVMAAAKWAGARLRAGWAVPALALLLPVFLIWSNFGPLDRSSDRTARDAWAPLLSTPLPEGSLVVSNDRDEIVPQWYVRYVEDVRPDVTGLFPLLAPGSEWSNVARVTETALATGRPVYLAKPMPGLEVKFRLTEQPGDRGKLGPLVHVERMTGDPALVTSIDFGGKLRLTGYDAAPADGEVGALQVTLHWQALQPLGSDYTTTVKLLDAMGAVLAASDHRPGGVYYPSSLWLPGETLYDAHRLAGFAGRGQEPYELEVGVYLNRGAAGIESLGEAARIGRVNGP